MLRGLRQGRAWGEISYPLAGCLALGIGWGILGDKWLGFLPIAFVAWGDGVAGLTRSWTKSWHYNATLPSLAILACCGGIAALFQPYWVGVAGALAATVTERAAPRIQWLRDDNLAIVLASLSVMALLTG